MRLIVLFDLPVTTNELRKEYSRFRNFLLDDGFLMMQYSIYVRFCRNVQDANKHNNRIAMNAPRQGNVRILTVTEKQYEDMIMIIGDKSVAEEEIKSTFTLVI